MRKKYLIGVDLGTAGTKAALYRLDGSLVAQASEDVPIRYPEPGVVEQDQEDFYRTAAHTVRTAIEQSGIDPHDIAAIGFDSQMAGVGAVDDQFQPVGPFDSWLDMRCEPYIEWLTRNHGELITRLTGCPPTADHGPKIMWSRDERPDFYRRTAAFVMPSCYVAGRMAELTADKAFIDYTFLHFSALSDAQAGTWSDELIAILNVDRAKLPRIVKPWQVIGEVREKAAKDFGLAVGMPIVAGAGDTAAGALGAGIVRPGMIFDTAGTASVFAGTTDQFVADTTDRALLTMRSVVEGLWNPLAYIAGGGLALRWFRDTFYAEGRPTDTLYDEMAHEAEQIAPGADGLFFSPHLNGRVCPANAHMRGAWVGFGWSHTKAHFFRSVLESIAFEYAYYLGILRRLVPTLTLTEARVIGGGAKSSVWNQIKANVLGVPYQRLARSEFATWGSALIAGYGVGLFTDLPQKATETTATEGAPIANVPAITATYRPLVQQYIDWQRELSQTSRVFAAARAAYQEKMT